MIAASPGENDLACKATRRDWIPDSQERKREKKKDRRPSIDVLSGEGPQ